MSPASRVIKAIFAAWKADSCLAAQFISVMPDNGGAKCSNHYAAKDITRIVHADVETGKRHDYREAQGKIAVTTAAGAPEEKSCGKSADRMAGRKGKRVGQMAKGQKLGVRQERTRAHDEMLQDFGYATAEKNGTCDEYSLLARGFVQCQDQGKYQPKGTIMSNRVDQLNGRCQPIGTHMFLNPDQNCYVHKNLTLINRMGKHFGIIVY